MSLQTNTTALNALLSAVNALPEKIDTSGTAVAADIYAGKTATVNDVKLTGSNPYNSDNVEPAVANALAELAEKGVDTTGAGIADIAGLIAAIESGGGGAKIAEGTITPSENMDKIVINHGLEGYPQFAAITCFTNSNILGPAFICETYYPNDGYYQWYTKAGGFNTSAKATVWSYASNKQPTGTNHSGDSYYINHPSVNEISFNKGDCAPFQSGEEYYWFAIGGLA